MASIRTAGLTKDFGDLRAVNEIDLDLPEGGVAGFVGPNGAGKSTTIRMLLGLIAPTGDGGEVLGCPISRLAAYLASGRCVDRNARVPSDADGESEPMCRRTQASLATFLQVSGRFPLTNAVVGKGLRSRSGPSASSR
jgi:ATPase subunit of ABC transporter with duplicated ATPase domains